MEDTKGFKNHKKEKESPEIKEELSDEELKGATGGHGFVEPRNFSAYNFSAYADETPLSRQQ